MKNLLLLLLLANILYFLWSRYVEEPPVTGVVVVNESDLGPPLPDTAVPEAATSVGAVLGSGRRSDLEFLGRSCVSIGPLEEETAQDALADYRGEGMQAQVRELRGVISIRYRVQIRNIADRATGEAMVDKLKAAGVDAYMEAPNDDARLISLGLFSEKSGAERIELQARSLDLPVEVTQRIFETGDYFVDIRLPPGKGAGAIIDRYGEELVFLSGEAKCPQGN
jgi:hypothetical protein